MKFNEKMLLLYAVTDQAWVGKQTLLEQIEAALKGGATIVQLREKKMDEDSFVAEAIQVRELCHKYNVPLIINDNVDEDAFRKALGAKRSAEVKKDLAAKKRTLQKSENRLAELDKLFKRIYEDMVNGKLSEARFQMLSDDYEQEQEELRAKIEMLENEIQNQEDQEENVDRFIRVAKKHLYLEKLTPDVLNDMVQAVYVHAPDTSSGQRIQDVDISYNYIGILPANLLYDIINGKAA